MAQFTPQQVAVAGVVPVYNAASASDTIINNNGKTVLHIKNGNAAPTVVSVDDPNSVSPEGATAFNPDATNTVVNATEEWMGPFPVSRFGTTLTVTFSVTATVTYSILQLP